MMNLLILFFFIFMAAAVIALDFRRKINLMHPLLLTIFLIIGMNLVALVHWFYTAVLFQISSPLRILWLTAGGIFLAYMALRLNLFPVRDGKKVSPRLKTMIGGRFLAYTAIWTGILQILFYVIGYPILTKIGIPAPILVINTICNIIFWFLMLANGILRMLFTSKRLSVLRRIVMLATMWIPIVNLIVLTSACRLVYAEYDFACYKQDLRLIRADSDLCQTKYPLILVHGIFFRDLKYFNYWGRIPKELTRYGALIYYGNQEAVGTIAVNSEAIRDKILQVIAETGCEKVNIIAHSKGGLDSRQAISKLGMDQYVASLTTINTPHRGCRFVDLACRLPEGIYRSVAKIFDNTFRRIGDQKPDFYTATHQFTTTYLATFNKEVKNSPQVYYQSYMSVMNNITSDPLLCIPYALIKPLEGANDGLVSLESAKWGDFRQLFLSRKRRGISHADIIDLKREDYKGFDVVEAYIHIVEDLKKKGF